MVVCEALVSLRARRVRAGRGVLQLQASDGDRPGGLFMISPELQPTHAAKIDRHTLSVKRHSYPLGER